MRLHGNSHLSPQHYYCPRYSTTADALASESEANGEPFLIHKLPTPLAVKKQPAHDSALMRRTFAAPSYGPNTQPYNRIKRTIAKWIAADCLPYRIVETAMFRAMMRNLDPKCPDFSRKAIISQMGHCHEYCSVLPTFLNMCFPIIAGA